MRIYDANKIFLGSGITNSIGNIVSGTNAVSYKINIDSATELYSNVAYVRLSAREYSNASTSI